MKENQWEATAVLYFLTLAKDKEPHSHVDKDPWKTKKLYQVICKQKPSFQADKPWNILKKKTSFRQPIHTTCLNKAKK